MATRTKEVIIRETKQNVFAACKVVAPEIFGDKVWTDVALFISDPDDESYFKLVFIEEDDS